MIKKRGLLYLHYLRLGVKVGVKFEKIFSSAFVNKSVKYYLVHELSFTLAWG